MTAALHRIDPFAEQGSDFNREAATVVLKRMLAMDEDEALSFGRILLADSMAYDYAAHGVEIAKARGAEHQRRFRLAKAQLAQSAVSKARAGQDNAGEFAAMVALYKAMGADPYNRDPHGEFAHIESRRYEAHTHIDYRTGYKQMRTKHATQQGVPAASALKGTDKANYQQAYRQIADLVAPYRRSNLDPLLHLSIEHKDGSVTTEILSASKKGELDFGDTLAAGDRVISAQVSVAHEPGMSSAVYEAGRAAGAPRAAAYAAGSVQHGALNARDLAAYHAKINPKATDQSAFESGTTRAFHRVGAASSLLQDSLGDAAPRKVQYALAVANHVGTHGPEAEKVIGPAADRAAYRYRGTERKVDPRLGTQLEAIRLDPSRQSPAAKAEYLFHGSFDEDENWRPSGALAYFGPNGPVLPKAELNTLQRMSGKIPPSQGVIIDRHGAVAHQAVGFGDDWYLPFNLKNLTALRGGEYIRTRTFGGPTTEDLYTALMSGARRMAVVSHNGVYVVEFDDHLRGGRRFNDKALGMTGRYGYLLDAVQSRQVTTAGVHPSRMREIEAEVSAQYDPVEDEDAYTAELRRRVKGEGRRPMMSKEQRDQAAVDFLNRKAEDLTTGDGQVMSADDLLNNYVDAQAGIALRGHIQGARSIGVAPVRDLDFYRNEQLARLRHPGDSPEQAAAKVAAALNMSPEFEAWMTRAEADNAAGVTPLQLNGQGYAAALSALREQYPYYIKRTAFYPWVDAHNRSDTGYVKPRHNRPAMTLAGYFDPEITGAGKAAGHTTRYQNYAVHQGRVSRPAEFGPVKAKADQAEAGGTAKAPGKLSSTDQAELRQGADLALLEHLTSHQNFTGEASLPDKDGNPISVADQKVEDVLKMSLPDSPFKRLWAKGGQTSLETRLKDAKSAQAAHDELADTVAFVRKQKLFHLDEALVTAHERGGAVAEERTAQGSVADYLDHLTDDIAYGGVYSALGAVPKPEAVAAEYQRNRAIEAVTGDAGLPAEIEAPDFTARAKKLAGELRAERGQQLRDLAEGRRPAGERVLLRRAEGLHRATQLHRRYQGATERARSSAAAEAAKQAAQAPPAPQVQLDVRPQVALPPIPEGMSPEQFHEYVAPYVAQAGQQTGSDIQEQLQRIIDDTVAQRRGEQGQIEGG